MVKIAHVHELPEANEEGERVPTEDEPTPPEEPDEEDGTGRRRRRSTKKKKKRTWGGLKKDLLEMPTPGGDIEITPIGRPSIKGKKSKDNIDDISEGKSPLSLKIM